MQRENFVTRPCAAHGRLLYLVGASGAGKDSLLAWVEARLPAGTHVRIARRTITRAAQADGERHIAVSEARFQALVAAGAFAMQWRANGHTYGVDRGILAALEVGATVVVNGSRAHLAHLVEAAAFPKLEVVHVTAPPRLLAERLRMRNREAQE